MELLLTLFTAIATSVAVVPLMMRLAPRLGMVDHPNSRKVHGYPVPRVGGWGVVFGALAAIVAFVPFDRLVLCYIYGVVVLFAFGAWDDRRELGHYVKFAGQFAAVLPIVTFAGLYVTDFPFVGEGVLPAWFLMLFTMFALVGMANAINHSDGLDGLAGGEAALSLVAIAFLAYLANGDLAVLIAVAVIGGLFGFLRYNTHPAVVFMGDNGSQAIGFSLGVLAILLTQRIDTTLSPAVVALILGLPIADILYVLYRRIREGRNWFRATRNHVHHRLMERGFTHKQSVIIIYSVQVGMVSSGVLLRHQSDWLIASVYLGVCAALFGALHVAERRDWKLAPRIEPRLTLEHVLSTARRYALLVVVPRRFLEIGIPAYLVLAAVGTNKVTSEMGAVSLALFALLGANLALTRNPRAPARRALLFLVGGLVVYLSFAFPWRMEAWLEPTQYFFFALLTLAIAAAVRFNPGRRKLEFKATAIDYLIAFVVVIPILVMGPMFQPSAGFLVALLVLLYGLELLITERRERREFVSIGSLVAVGVLAVKGLAT